MCRIVTVLVGAGMQCLIYSAGVSASDTTIVSASIVKPSCDVNVPATMSVGPSDGTITSGATLINKDWHYIYSTGLNVTLSGCQSQGAGMMLTPSLTLNMSAVTDGSADRQQKIFSNVGNTTGIGFVVKNTVGGSSTLEDGVNTNLVTVADPRVSLGEAGFSPGNGEQVLLVGLACGSAMDCSMTRLRAGVAKLTITFAFEYQ